MGVEGLEACRGRVLSPEAVGVGCTLTGVDGRVIPDRATGAVDFVVVEIGVRRLGVDGLVVVVEVLVGVEGLVGVEDLIEVIDAVLVLSIEVLAKPLEK